MNKYLVTYDEFFCKGCQLQVEARDRAHACQTAHDWLEQKNKEAKLATITVVKKLREKR